MGQIVDVFRGASEVDKLGYCFQFSVAGKALLDKILNGFDIVVGGRLDGLDTLRIVFIEVGGD